MTRIPIIGRCHGRLVRGAAAVKSAAAWARLWRRLSWDDRMWLLWADESTPPSAADSVARDAGRALRRAWIVSMLSQSGAELPDGTGPEILLSRHHNTLWQACRRLNADYKPYGTIERDGPDCSAGCRHFYALADRNDEEIGYDWGVCGSPISHRSGLLTFEHQACAHFQV